MKPAVKIRRELLVFPVAFVSEVRRQLRLEGVSCEDLSRMESAALNPDGSPLRVALEFADIKIASRSRP